MGAPPAISVDRLDTGDAVEVVPLSRFRVGGDGPVREPHRHDYHELIWIREGCGEHLIDGRPLPVAPGTVTLIGRGQVHVFRGADIERGAVLRFGDDLLLGEGGGRAGPGWLLAGAGGRSIPVPPGDQDDLEAALHALHAETTRPPDGATADLERHLVSTILLWLERWYDASRAERHEPEDEAVQLHRRFARLLERDFARRHDAAHYADALAVPPAALSRALTHVTGRSTKELITDRVMIEARRLLRFTGLTIGQVAFQTGFADQFYFSRAFKRHTGEAPKAFRDRVRGRAA